MSRPPQNTVRVRIDVILYAVTAVVVILALASILTHDVDVALIGTLLTFATGAFTGWLAYLRVCNKQNGKDAGTEDGPETSPLGVDVGLGPPASTPKGKGGEQHGAKQ